MENNNASQSSTEKSQRPLDLYKNFYEQTRKQIEHEDSLIHYRVTWLLTLQGFLFAAYGVVVAAKAALVSAELQSSLINRTQLSRETEDLRHLIDSTLPILAILGIILSILLLFGITAAAKSINRLSIKWDNLNRESSYKEYFPQIIGRIYGFTYMGLSPAYGLPAACAVAWGYLQWSNEDVQQAFSCGVIIILIFWLANVFIGAIKWIISIGK